MMLIENKNLRNFYLNNGDQSLKELSTCADFKKALEDAKYFCKLCKFSELCDNHYNLEEQNDREIKITCTYQGVEMLYNKIKVAYRKQKLSKLLSE